jgi:hypothetical protein|tara:strand:+ start:2596 stop:2808 length:213 start_codon:yes stop_codon:yes gene_type:complete
MSKPSSWIRAGFIPVTAGFSSGGGLSHCTDCGDRILKFCYASPTEVGTRCEIHQKLYIGRLVGKTGVKHE